MASATIAGGCVDGVDPASHDAASPPPGAALGALDPGAASLLPRAAVATPPTPAPPAQGLQASVPAFDRRFVADLPRGRTYSIGTTSDGYLVGGVPIPASEPALAARPISVRRDAVFGTPLMMEALVRAARRVGTLFPGSVLWAGDVSGRHGGDLAGHASHNSGRDVDLAFYLRAADGRIADDAGFPAIRPDGSTADGRVFDTARNWALVEALLRDPKAQVQWIFCAAHLEEAMLAWAQASGADATILARAERALSQPRGSSPHDDHFHVRIYCDEDERLEGCLDAPPFHPWIRRHDDAVERFVATLTPFLRPDLDEELRYAVTRLVRLNATSAAPRLERLAARIDDPTRRLFVEQAAAFLRGERGQQEWQAWRVEEHTGE